jgi:transposase
MIPIPSGVQVRLAVGRTDMRKGMNTLALQVQALHRDPHGGDLYVRPSGWTVSGCRVDRLLGVLILELYRAEVTES